MKQVLPKFRIIRIENIFLFKIIRYVIENAFIFLVFITMTKVSFTWINIIFYTRRTVL